MRSKLSGSMVEEEDEASAGRCACPEPADPKKEAHVQSTPAKQCSVRCKLDFQGATLKEVFILSNESYSAQMCITGKVWNYVARVDGKLPQGGCALEERDVSGAGDPGMGCLHQGFVEYILMD